MELKKILIYTSDRGLISSIYKEHKTSQTQTNKKRQQTKNLSYQYGQSSQKKKCKRLNILNVSKNHLLPASSKL